MLPDVIYAQLYRMYFYQCKFYCYDSDLFVLINSDMMQTKKVLAEKMDIGVSIIELEDVVNGIIYALSPKQKVHV